MTDGNDAETNSDGTILLDEIILDIGRGKPFPTYLFATTKATEVESINKQYLMDSNYTKSIQQTRTGPKSHLISDTSI